MESSETRGDAELAQAAASGDSDAFAQIYDRYAERLWAFCVSMLRSRSDAEDVLQDVFVIASTRLVGLRDPNRLRSWLFAVARNEGLTRIARRSKEVLVDDFHDDTVPSGADEEMTGDRRDLAALLAASGEGLSDRDRLALNLADVEGLDGHDLASALGVPRSTAYTLVARARSTARDCLGALLVARTGSEDCDALRQILAGWDGRLTPLHRKRITRHIEACETCTEQRKRVASPAVLLGGAGQFVAVPAAFALPASLRERILHAAVDPGAPGNPGDPGDPGSSSPSGPSGGEVARAWRGGWPPGLSSAPRRRPKIVLAVAAAVVVAVVVVGFGWGAITDGDDSTTVAITGDRPTSEPVAAAGAESSTTSELAAVTMPPDTARPDPGPEVDPPLTPTKPPPETTTPTTNPPVTDPTTPPTTVVMRTLTVHVIAGGVPSSITSSTASPDPTTCAVGQTCTFTVTDGAGITVTGASFSAPCVATTGTCVVLMDQDRVLSVYGPVIS